MAESENNIRLSKVIRELNVSINHIFDYLEDQGHKLERNPNAKISQEMYSLLQQEFAQDREEKEEAKQVLTTRTKKESILLEEESPKDRRERERDQEEVLIKDMNAGKSTEPAPAEKKEKAETPKTETKKAEVKAEEEITRVKPEKTVGVKVVTKIDLEATKEKPKRKKKRQKPPKKKLPLKKRNRRQNLKR